MPRARSEDASMRQHKPRRKRDVLGLALRSMILHEEIICTERTLDNIRPRLAVFQKIYSPRVYADFVRNGIACVKRTA